VVGDFNADGKPDLAVANSGSDDVSVLLGNGDGAFQTAVNYGAGSVPYSLAAGDFNGDGTRDLAVANVGTSNDTSYTLDDVSVLLGNACNSAPVALCKDVSVPAAASCSAGASIDNGSFDPDSNDTITLTQTPAGGYPLGETSVTLTATDSHGMLSSCASIVTVVDQTAPTIHLIGADPLTILYGQTFEEWGRVSPRQLRW